MATRSAIKLTRTSVDRVRAPDPSGKQKLVWDTELKGFGLLISGATASKSYVAQRTLPDGRTRRVTIGSTCEIDLDAARSEAGDLIHQMRHGEDPKAVRKKATVLTLRSALDQYLKWAEAHGRRAKTISDYRKFIERYLGDWLALPLAAINRDMVESRHVAIQAEIAKRRVNPAHFQSRPGAHQADAVMVTLRAIWNFADRKTDSDLPALPRNPTRNLSDQWLGGPRRARLVKADELPAFFAAVQALDSRTARDFMTLLLFTGLRRGEAAALSWPEIDFTARLIRLPAKRTKNQQPLDLPMSSFVHDLLVARRELGRERSGWVFPADAKSGHIMEPGRAFNIIAAATGIQVSAHDLRRTFITNAESCDISGLALKALVNHSLSHDVTDGYVRMTVDRLRKPAQLVTDRLMQLCGIADIDSKNIARLA